MRQQASRYASVTAPARALLGDLAIDVFFRASSRRERRDQREHVRDGRVRARNGANRYFAPAVELVHRLVEIDVPATKPSAHDHSTFHVCESSSFGGLQPEAR